MTIEERLEKLTERHEALTQTVEVVAGMQRENEKIFASIATSIQNLFLIVQSHDRRLTDLEGS